MRPMTLSGARRSLKASARRHLLRLALRLCGNSRDARQLMFEEMERYSPKTGRVLHRDGPAFLVEGIDHILWCREDDQLIATGLIKHGHWQRDDFEVVLQYLDMRGRLGTGTFVNVGANIGTQVIYAAIAKRFDHIVAYEPEPNNFNLLQRNVATNNLNSGVSLVQSAVSEHGHGLNLNLDPTRPGMHHVSEASSEQTICVPSVELDESLAALDIPSSRVALVWIDVEGHERQVFRGMRSVINLGTPVLFEYSRSSCSQIERREWRRELERCYSSISSVEQGVITATTFEAAFEIDFTNLLVY